MLAKLTSNAPATKLEPSSAHDGAEYSTPSLSPVCEMTANDRERLLTLEKRLKERIVGQDQAVEDIVNYILRTRAGLAEPNERTSGIFLFVGPNGCGKSLLAKRLFCELYDGDERDVVEIHLGEYGERSSLSRLIGGSIENGHEEEGELIAPVLYRPNTVILLREVERAHPHILAVLLRLLNQGRFKTDQGQVVDFSKAMIIFTSAVGASSLLQTDSNTSMKTRKLAHQRTMTQVHAKFRSDFLTRLSEIVMFNSFDISSLEEICFMALKNVRNLLASKGVCVALEKPAVRAIIADCYDQSSGAGTIDKYLEQKVVTALSKMLIRGELTRGDTVKITVSDKVQNDLEPHGDRGKRDLRFQIEHGKTSAKNIILADHPNHVETRICSPEDSDKSSDIAPVHNFNVLLSAVDSVASSKSSLKRKQPLISPLNGRFETAKLCGEKRKKHSFCDSFSQENQKNYLKSMPDTSRSESLSNPSLSCLRQKNKTGNSIVSESSTSILVAEDDVASEKHFDHRSMASVPSFAMENFAMFQEKFGPQSSVPSVTSSMAEVWKTLSPEERKIWEELACQGKEKAASQQDEENSTVYFHKNEKKSKLGSFHFSKPLHESPRDEHVNHPLLMHNERSGQSPLLCLGDYGMWLMNSNNVNYPSGMNSISHPFVHYPNVNMNGIMANDPAMRAKQMPVANSLNYLAHKAPNRIDGSGAMDCEISTITNSIATENTEKRPASVAEEKRSSSQSCRWCSAASNDEGVSLYCHNAFMLFCDFHRYQDKDFKVKEKKPTEFWRAVSNEEHDFWIEKVKEEISASGASSPKATSVPKKPMSAFLFYSKEHRKSIMKKNTDLKFQNISKAVSNMWVNATDEEKSPFLQGAKKDRERYVREMEEWTNKWNALKEEREKVLNADCEKEN